MAQEVYQYDKLVEGALRGVVRDVLAQVARDGLRGEHHFYIAFATQMPGVEIPDQLRAKYPGEMTIVLQHQFWGLEIGDTAFSVTLSFQKQPERLIIPFAAVRSFADPSANFVLEFAARSDASAAGRLPAPVVAVPDAAAKPERPAAEIVALDSFRKR